MVDVTGWRYRVVLGRRLCLLHDLISVSLLDLLFDCNGALSEGSADAAEGVGSEVAEVNPLEIVIEISGGADLAFWLLDPVLTVAVEKDVLTVFFRIVERVDQSGSGGSSWG